MKATTASAMPAASRVAIQRGGERRADAARAQHGHAADDPGRAPAADVGAVAQPGPQHLHGIVQRDQRPGSIAGSASSTTITRLSVEVVSTTIAPSAPAPGRAGRCRASRAGRPLMQHAWQAGRTAKARPACPARRGSCRWRCTRPPARAGSAGGASSARAGPGAAARPAIGVDRAPPGDEQATTTTCGTAITRQATRAARSTPSRTGSEPMPMRRSPSTDLKSFSVMMPCAPTL